MDKKSIILVALGCMMGVFVTRFWIVAFERVPPKATVWYYCVLVGGYVATVLATAWVVKKL